MEEEEMKEPGERIPVKNNRKRKTLQAPKAPQQNGKRQHDGYKSSSSDDEDVQRAGHQKKETELVILTGDFTCIVDLDGRFGGDDSKLGSMSRFMVEAVKVTKLHYVFSIPADKAQPHIHLVAARWVYLLKGKNKTPGSDGLPDELYSALWDLTGQNLLELSNNALLAVHQEAEACSIVETLGEKERVDPVGCFPEQMYHQNFLTSTKTSLAG
eukprot:g45354.t1